MREAWGGVITGRVKDGEGEERLKKGKKGREVKEGEERGEKKKELGRDRGIG